MFDFNTLKFNFYALYKFFKNYRKSNYNRQRTKLSDSILFLKTIIFFTSNNIKTDFILLTLQRQPITKGFKIIYFLKK